MTTRPVRHVTRAGAATLAIALTASAQCPSDLNGDGFVDGQDLGILLGNWGLCE